MSLRFSPVSSRFHPRALRCAAVLLSAALAGSASPQTLEDPARPFPLMVGDPPPPLQLRAWIQGVPVPRFVAGQTYVVEFWATWCAPCAEQIPHLSALQAKYADRLTVIAVSVWEPSAAEVPAFVSAKGDAMAYRVALDSWPDRPAESDASPARWAQDHGLTSLAWLRASGWERNGIPVAFVLDARGTIAWVGEPRELDEPLERILSGTWDAERYRAEYRERMSLVSRSAALQDRLADARRRRDWEGAIAALDALIALDPSMLPYTMDKLEILLVELRDADRGYAYARELIAGIAKDERPAMNTIARMVLDEDVPRRDLDVALAASRRAEQISGGTHTDTLVIQARVHAARGDFAAAADAQRRAIAHAKPDAKRELERTLAEYDRRSSTGRGGTR